MTDSIFRKVIVIQDVSVCLINKLSRVKPYPRGDLRPNQICFKKENHVLDVYCFTSFLK